MSLFGLDLEPPAPTDVQKIYFRRAISASVGRQCLDPKLRVFIESDGYGAVTKEVVSGDPGGVQIVTKEVFLGTDGLLTVSLDTDFSADSLAREIRARRALEERQTAIEAYCAETGRSRLDAEMVILDHMLDRPSGIEAATQLIAHVEGMGSQTAPGIPIDGFELADLTNRIIRTHVAI